MAQNKLERRLDFNDMFFTGVSYMIGAGIFTLLPLIIQYGGKNAWIGICSWRYNQYFNWIKFCKT